MQTNTIAVVIAHNGAKWLSTTLSEVQRQGVDDIVIVDAGSTDETAQIISAAGLTRVVVVPAHTSFADAVQRGLNSLGRQPANSDFVWILHDDSAPGPEALQRMLQAAERNSNAAVFGPKLYAWDAPSKFQSFGITMTRTGVAVSPAKGELDQAQFDDYPDTLAVSTAGMLVRWRVWDELAGLDPALSFTDDGLDFGVRARLAGYRVVRVAEALVRHAASAPRGLDRHEQDSGARRVRGAQLYRHFVYAKTAVLPLLWIVLIPMAIAKSVWLLLTKRPRQVFDEWAATVGVFGKIASIRRARKRVVRKSGFRELRALRLDNAGYRQIQAQSQLADTTQHTRVLEYQPFWSSAGPWVVLAMALVSLVSWWPLLSANGLSGGGLVPLSGSVGELWGSALHYFHDGVSGVSYLPDPGTWILAILGTITFWNPSLSIVLLWLLALPLAAFGAFMAAGTFTTKSWTRSVIALAWALFPTFLYSLGTGKLFAVIAHLLLPVVLRLCAVALSSALTRQQRITSVAGAALALGVAAIGSPLLTALAVVMTLVVIAVQPRRGLLLLWLPVPALLMAIPNVVQAISRKTYLALLSDAGMPNADASVHAWKAAMGMPVANPLMSPRIPFTGQLWDKVNAALPWLAVLIMAVAVVAVLTMLVRGKLRVGIIGLSGIILGLGASVVASRISVTGGQSPSMWAGAAISVGLLAATPAIAQSFGNRHTRVWPQAVIVLLVLAQAAPWVAATVQGQSLVTQSAVPRVPAIVAAQENARHNVDVLSASIGADNVTLAALRSGGPVLNRTNVAFNAREQATPQAVEIANSVAGLILGSDAKAVAGLREHGYDFVLVDGEVNNRQVQTISSAAGMSVIGKTDYGYLWQITDPSPELQSQPRLALGAATLWGITLLVLVLLAIPTSRLPWRAVDNKDPLAEESGMDAADPFAQDAVDDGGSDE